MVMKKVRKGWYIVMDGKYFGPYTEKKYAVNAQTSFKIKSKSKLVKVN